MSRAFRLLSSAWPGLARLGGKWHQRACRTRYDRCRLGEAEARRRFYLVDRGGLLVEGMPGLQSFQVPFAQRRDQLGDWELETPTRIGLADVIRNAHPTTLIGTSGQPNAFTEEIVREMACHVRQPIIFPLSIPLSVVRQHRQHLIVGPMAEPSLALVAHFRR